LHVEDYVSVAEAQRIISTFVTPRRRTELVKTVNAGGRVAAVDFMSPVSVPQFPMSHMDGYAVVASDLRESRRKPLLLKGEARLGDRVTSIKSGESMRVPTGGRLPIGADAVVPVEEARKSGKMVYVSRDFREGDFTYAEGSDVRKGELILAKGRAIRAQDVGMLLSLGAEEVKVFTRPRVAIIATGSELTNRRVSGKTRNSHTQIFANLIRDNGGEVVDFGIVPDKKMRIAASIEKALREADLVLTLGGTSLGRSDIVVPTVRSLAKGESVIHGIRLDRGRVMGVAAIKGKPIVMMPGPIQGAMNAFLIFALPFMVSLSGETHRLEPVVQARLAEKWEARKRFRHFTKVLHVKLERRESGVEAQPIMGDTESMRLLTNSDGFVVVPEETVELRAGTRVSVRLLAGFSFVLGGFPF